MRDYAKLAGTFWTGDTGKALKREGQEAVIAALYLLSCPVSNMLGLYYLPMIYLAHESGLGSEGASKGLAGAIKAGFCKYDEASECVWVMEMAAWQIAEALDTKDNRCKGVQREYDALPENPFLTAFYERYAESFHMTACRGKAKGQARGSKAPTKPRTGTGARTGAGDTSTGASLPCPYQTIVDLYHSHLPDLPSVRLMGDDREKAMRKFWGWVLSSIKSDGTRRAETAEQALDWIGSYFKRANDNDWLMGRAARNKGHENWTADFDFLLTDKGKKHVIEKTREAA